MTTVNPNPSLQERSVTSYHARRRYAPGVVRSPEQPGVEGTIDIHCHAHEGQQDALAIAQYASQCGMQGLLYKSIIGRPNVVDAIGRIRASLEDWCAAGGYTPCMLWAGCSVVRRGKPFSADFVRKQIESGVTAVWMPNNTHANTYLQVGGKPIWWDANADPKAHIGPMPWEKALEVGDYLLDDSGHLLREAEEMFRIANDLDAAVFFGHATHREIYAMAELVERLGFRRAVIDHPFSPFVNLSATQMKEMADIGITLNFTYDELSPLLGIDPQAMYNAIRHIGVEHCTLSSDAGEPLLPNTVESMRLIRSYMEAFGMNKDELYTLCTLNPAKVVGLELAAEFQSADIGEQLTT